MSDASLLPPPHVELDPPPPVRPPYDLAIEFIHLCNDVMGLHSITYTDPVTKEPKVEFRTCELHPKQEAAFRAACELVRQTFVTAYVQRSPATQEEEEVS